MPTSINKQNARQNLFNQFFFYESFYFNEIEEAKKNSLQIAAVKEEIFSSVQICSFSEFSEDFSLYLWLYHKALIDQLVRSIPENI